MFDLPFELILATVPVVEPAPGRPPKRAATKFPIPYPINSRFPLCLFLLNYRQQQMFSKVSIVPNPAKVNPLLTIAMLKSEK